MVHESVDHEKLWWVCLIDLIHDTRNLCTHLKADGIRASHVVSQSANKRKKLPLQEIEVEFVYHRQVKMKNFSS